jgi:hypothetical protein
MTLHSELGIVAVPPVESLRTYLPPDKLWPINDLWGLHDLSQERGPAYLKRLNDCYGPANGVEDFCRKAQLLNLESAKAMLETWQSHQGSGGLIWMTQSAWPSMICQAYAYDFEATGAYYGFRKACEPLHILWDSYTNRIKVANDTPNARTDLTAEASVYGLDGVKRWTKSRAISIASTSAADCFLLDVPADISNVYFVKLRLTASDGSQVSDNFYWASTNEHQYQAMAGLPRVRVDASARQSTVDGTTKVTVEMTNPTTSVAVGIRLMLVHADTGERVLPAFYDDNYFSLLPGERRTVSIEVGTAAPMKLKTEGWNVEPGELSVTQ